MIGSIADRETRRIHEGKISRRLPPEIQARARKLMRVLGRSKSLNDLRAVPGNRLEKLRGDRKVQHSVRINNQWRICFTWREDTAFDVEITDHYN